MHLLLAAELLFVVFLKDTNGIPLTPAQVDVAPPKQAVNAVGKPLEADVLDGLASESDSCAALLRQVAKKSPFSMVGHAIHSMTLQDLRKFDPEATSVNFVPTINRDITSGHSLLSHAPDVRGPDDKMFLTEPMKSLDLSLSHMDDAGWEIKYFSTLEKIVHNFHMEEVWARAMKQFEIIKITPPSKEACDCVMDIGNNGILKFLRFTALAIREPALVYGDGLMDEKETKQGQLDLYTYPVYTYHFNKATKDKSWENMLLRESKQSMPRLVNSAAWIKWKQIGETSEAEDYNTALFLHCAIRKAHNQ